MKPNTSFPDNGGKFLDTLAQSRTTSFGKSPVLLFGEGSDLHNFKALGGRAKRKFITQTMVLSVIDVARKKGDLEMIKQLWNTYHCQERIYTSDSRLFGDYCKNRICTLCNSNRKADLINRYLPIIEGWPDPQFLTLTIKAVPAKQLRNYIEAIVRAFKEIKDAQRKRYARGKGIQLIGIKSLECNFNPIARTYNPHLHVLIPTKEIAELLKKEWLRKWTWQKSDSKGKIRRQLVIPYAQKICPVKDSRASLMEIIKYGTKIFTEPDLNKKSKQKASPYVYAAALYNILKAMQVRRLFDRFGFSELVTNKREATTPNVISDYDQWQFHIEHSDWINTEDGTLLTGYQPPQDLLSLLNDNVNTQLE